MGRSGRSERSRPRTHTFACRTLGWAFEFGGRGIRDRQGEADRR